MPSLPTLSPLLKNPANPFSVMPLFPNPVLLTFSLPMPPSSATLVLSTQPLVIALPLSKAIALVPQPFAATLSTYLLASLESQLPTITSATPLASLPLSTLPLLH